MPTPIRVDSDFHSHRSEQRRSLNAALQNRRSYLGFVLGMAATLVIAFGVAAYAFVRLGS